MTYSIDPSCEDCYEGTTCLINKFGITDYAKLSLIEASITFAKAVMLEDSPICGSFDFEHFKDIHRFLFSDIYTWAGEIRTTNISKKRTAFLNADQINTVAEKCFSKVVSGYFDGLTFKTFAKRIAEFYRDVNYIHPFREGNGRTQRIYFAQLIRKYGYEINFSEVDTDELLFATIQASGGVIDFLVDFFENSIKKAI